MAEEIKRDSDAGTQSQIGVGRVDQTTKALHEIQPNWVEDGLGIVGPQRQRVRPPEEGPRRMDFNFPNDSSAAPPATGPCAPTAPPDTGTYVWGSVDGTCQWIDTTTC
jgi:hypothetical protein